MNGLLSVALVGLGWWMAAGALPEQSALPPAYHDEYSYLLQAETFRAGQLWFPVAEQFPQLFDQMHVLNEPDLDPPRGRFASRYFPGPGLWLNLGLWWGSPWLAQQLAHGLMVAGVFWIGRELADQGTGLLAAMLAACAPGLLIFSNLLLAHQPTLVGLVLFYWMFLRTRRTGALWSAALAGSGLAGALWCRPMTAAGASLFSGVAFGWWWLSGQGAWLTSATVAKHAASGESRLSFPQRSRLAVALAGPLLIGIAGLMLYQRELTGALSLSPYQLYTDRYTPRHVYGFNNVVRGEQRLGPKVIEGYDRWAENLTGELALQNVGRRLVSSWRWTLGIVPLAGVLLVWLLVPRIGAGGRWREIWGGVIGLHLVHVPYWFTGIMDWHYVYETAPLWLLLAAQVIVVLLRTAGCRLWLLTGVVLAVTMNLWTCPPWWPAPLDVAAAELRYPREIYAAFRSEVEQRRQGRPVLVLVTPDPADRSIDFVTNSPDLRGPVLIGRWRGEPLAEIRQAFSERLLLHFDASSRQFLPLPRP